MTHTQSIVYIATIVPIYIAPIIALVLAPKPHRASACVNGVRIVKEYRDPAESMANPSDPEFSRE